MGCGNCVCEHAGVPVSEHVGHGLQRGWKVPGRAGRSGLRLPRLQPVPHPGRAGARVRALRAVRGERAPGGRGACVGGFTLISGQRVSLRFSQLWLLLGGGRGGARPNHVWI